MTIPSDRLDDRPDEQIAELLALARRQIKRLQRTTLQPLKCRTLTERGFQADAAGHLPSIVGDIGYGTFALGPSGQPGKLRLSLDADLRGAPISLLIGRAFHFFTSQPAVGRLHFADKRLVDLPNGEEFAARTEGNLVLSADDGTGSGHEHESSPLPGAKRDRIEWRYDDAGDPPNFEIRAQVPDHILASPVVIDLLSLDDTVKPEQHVAVLQGPRNSHRELTAVLTDLGPEAFGVDVEVAIGPLQPDNPEQVHLLLAQEDLVALPLSPQTDGSYLVDFRWADQIAAAADPAMGWAVQLSLAEEAV